MAERPLKDPFPHGYDIGGTSQSPPSDLVIANKNGSKTMEQYAVEWLESLGYTVTKGENKNG